MCSLVASHHHQGPLLLDGTTNRNPSLSESSPQMPPSALRAAALRCVPRTVPSMEVRAFIMLLSLPGRTPRPGGAARRTGGGMPRGEDAERRRESATRRAPGTHRRSTRETILTMRGLSRRLKESVRRGQGIVGKGCGRRTVCAARNWVRVGVARLGSRNEDYRGRKAA